MTDDTGKESSRRYIKRGTAQARAYSQAVIIEGGRIVWLAGQVGAADSSGRSLVGDFDALSLAAAAPSPVARPRRRSCPFAPRLKVRTTKSSISTAGRRIATTNDTNAHE